MRNRLLLLCTVVLSATATMPVSAAATPRHSYAIESEDLGLTLRQLALESGVDIVFAPDVVAGKRSGPVRGNLTIEDALSAALRGTGLGATRTASGGFAIAIPFGASGQGVPRAENDGNDEIVVTGSRLRGAPIASPVIRLTREDIVNSGQTGMGDVVRDIPQNFGGGQNPGANVNVPGNKSEYIGSGSSIDLRGLGGDATLTLLNGHRLAYNGARQSIDVSAIPIAALDRLEIVADGSSALYGSDAVAGVANIILRRDYDGVNTSARFGAATDGGDQQQEYSVVAGQRWSSGGLMLAYDFTHNTPLLASQRSYAATTSPGLTLLPSITQHNVILTGHQALAANLEFDLDASYNHRASNRGYALTIAGDPTTYGAMMPATGKALSIAPSLRMSLGAGWIASLSGVYSEDQTFYVNDVARAGVHSVTAGCYCNSIKSAELAADGEIARLPGGEVKLALGGGYRSTGYHGYRTQGAPQDIDVDQRNYYVFGEIGVPIVGPDQNIPLIHRLNLGAAVRYERYLGVAEVATPKIGIIYAPSSILDLKASWGRSFKAPTFYERYSAQYASIYDASRLGGVGYPAGSTVLLLSGGNPDLKPERARTWTVTGTLHPPAIRNLTLEVSYFNVAYRNRILAPIIYTTQSLSDVNDRPYVQYNPSLADAAQSLIGRAITNYTTAAYNPASVVAIVQNSNLNAASQAIHGVDASAKYRFALGGTGQLSLSADGAYLDSNQRVSATGPVTQLAGAIYNPAHFRGRGGATWEQGSLTLASFANYVGPITDLRTGFSGRSRPMTTIDLSGSYMFRNPSGAMKGVAISASALNLFNRAPGTLKTAGVYDTPYDPLNYSPVGRFLNLSVSKQW